VEARIHRGGPVGRVAAILTALALSVPALSSVARAAEEEVSFKSDYQQEIRDEEVLLLQGNVEVHFREVVIYADEVRLNDKKDEFFGVGNIHLVGADRDIFADSIWYNYARDDFDMRNTRGSMLVQGVGEPVWFEAEQLKGNINNYKMVNGRLTTCTPTEHREYHIEARSIKVLPGNKIIFRNGYTFILNVPVVWFPFWAFSLAETPWTVKVGKDSWNGTYVNTTYNFMAEELIIGTLLMDYYAQTGWQIGGQHEYALPRHGLGRLTWTYLYGRYRDDATGRVTHANEYSFNASQPLRFGSRWTGSLGLNGGSRFNILRGRTNNVNGSISSNYKTASTGTSLNASLRQTSGVSQADDITLGLTHNRTLFGTVTANGKVDYRVSKTGNGTPAEEDFKAGMDFRQSRKGWDWDASIDTHWDPDGVTNQSDRNDSYTDRLPEINITLQPNAFPSKYRNPLGFAMQNLNLQGALYYIGPENKERNGFYGRMDTRFNRNFDFGKSHKVQANIDYWQAIASTGDARYVYGTQVSWTWDMSRKLKWQVNWNRSDNEGRIPFQGMDNARSPSNSLTWSLNYQNGRLYTIRLQTNYALSDRYAAAPGELLSIKRMSALTFSLNYTPSTKTRMTLQTQYDFARGDLGNITTSLSMTDFRSYRMQTDLSVKPPGSITRLGTSATFVVGKDWDFEVSAEAGSQSTGSIIRTIKVTHRFDCTFLSMQYGAQNDYWGFTWGVSAFPQAHLGWSSTEDAFGPGIFDTFQGYGGGFSGLNLGGTGGQGGFGSY